MTMIRQLDEYDGVPNENRAMNSLNQKIASETDSIMDVMRKSISNCFPTVQSSKTVFPNRKRRFRNSQEYLSAAAAASSSSTVNNGLLKKKSDLSCVVCADLAHGYNFDAISCESCKAFFRRNALFSMDRLKCRHDGRCEITAETRRRCKACRLKKCFAVGMRKEWILTEEEKVNKKRRIEENRKLRTTTNNDESQTDDDKVSMTKRDVELQNVLLNKNERLPLKPITVGQNNDLLSNVVAAFEDGFKLDPTSYGWSYPLARKITALCQILNTKNTTALRLISSYKRLPEFDMLNDMDKVNLVKSNLRYLFFFQGCLGYDPINDVYNEGNSIGDQRVFGSDIREAYGDDIHIRCTFIIRALHNIAQMDRRIIHLALVIFLFSKGLSNLVNMSEQSLDNVEQVTNIQNKYVEQLWVLLEKTYGSSRAVLIFSTLIEKCLLIQNLLRDIQQDVHEKLEPDEVSPIMRSVMQLS